MVTAAGAGGTMDPERRVQDRGLRILERLLASEERQGGLVEDMLYDPVTELPTLRVLLGQIKATLSDRHHVGLLTLQVNPLVRLETMFGWDTLDEVMRTISALLEDVKKEQLRDDDFVAELSMSGNSFVFVLSPPRYNPFIRYEDLALMRDRLGESLERKLATRFTPDVASQITCFIGCVVVTQDPSVPLWRRVLRALDQAYSDAFEERRRELHRRASALGDLIARNHLRTTFQPIVDLTTGRVLAYEMFNRGLEGEFTNPEVLFGLATETSQLWELERICRERAVRNLERLPRDAMLFVNVEPDSIFDPRLAEWAQGPTVGSRVVLEITERTGITDYPLFRKVLATVSDLGLRVAIDDVGSGYAGLRIIAETRPAYIKLDMNVTRNVDQDVVRRELVDMMVRFTNKTGIPLIVEGVETTEELRALTDLGVRYVQGYLLGRPSEGFSPVDLNALRPA